MENTERNKKLFFAQYYGQIVLADLNHGFVADNEACNWHLNFSDNYLMLAPLSSITEEDAVEFCRLNYGYSENHILKNDGSISIRSGRFQYTRVNDDFYNFNSKSSDYLRSKGYALPFMDLSVEKLIKYGWLKLKTS